MVSKINGCPCAGEHFLSGRIISTLRSLMFCLFGTFPALLFPRSLAYFVCMCVVICHVKVVGQLAGVGPVLHYQCPYLLNHLSGLHFHHFKGTAIAMFVG